MKCLESLASQLFSDEHVVDESGMNQCLEITRLTRFSTGNEDAGKTRGTNKDEFEITESMTTASPEISKINHGQNGRKTQATAAYNSSMRKRVLERVAKELEKPLYIVVDAVDECADYEGKELIPRLLKLTQSTIATIKVITSSREDVNLEEANRDRADHVVHQKDLKSTILFLNKDMNALDMEIYLNKELEALWERGMRRDRKQDALTIAHELNSIVTTIKKKAEEKFTYAAMVIVSLQQPYEYSLAEKLRQLPDGMDGLYKKSLESLTNQERKLVVIALLRIVWGFVNVTTVEIAEQFKRVYDHAASTSERAMLLDTACENKKIDDNYHTELSSSSNYDPLDDPEIQDTIFHLKRAGRDFFKFGNSASGSNLNTIDVIHKSIRDWVENEAKQVLLWQKKISAIGSLFPHDNQGQLQITIPVPRE